MKVRTAIFLIFQYFLFSGISFSSPAAPVAFEVIQPDGETGISVTGKGDESLNWHEVDGYAVIEDSDTGWWYFAEKDPETKKLKKGDYKAGVHNPSLYNLKKGIRPEHTYAVPAHRQSRSPTDIGSPVYSPPGLPHDQNILLIMVDFRRTQGKHKPARFRKMLFSEEGKSVKTYFNEVSNSNFRIIPAAESHGRRNDGVIGWLRLGKKNPDCNSEWDQESCYTKLAYDAISAANRYIKYSTFDVDGNGIIDPSELAIIILVAGHEEAYGCAHSSPSVWAHSWYLSTPVKADNKYIYDYAMFGEKHCDHRATMGIIVHELGHLMLGLPDLYDTDGGSEGVGNFDVMGTGNWGMSGADRYLGQTPVHPSAWSKLYAGFSSAIVVNDQAGVTFPAAATNSGPIVKLATRDEKQYFLLENRYFTGYDAGLEGLLEADSKANGGIAIWHIDEALLDNFCMAWGNCNADETHKLVDLEEAHGFQDMDSQNNRGAIKDLYYSDNKSTFSTTSNPNSRLYSGASAGVLVNRISASGPSMSADIGSVPGSVKLILPNGGETVTSGQNSVIVWTYTGDPGNLRIELYKGELLVDKIVSAVPAGYNDRGSYVWKVKAPAGEDYRIKIIATSPKKSYIDDISDGMFTINK